MRAWVLTDGKAGDEQQCLAIVEALGLSPEIRHVAPRAPFLWAMPFGPIDPRDRPGRPASPIAPPFPDLVVASGRRAVPYVRTVKRATDGRCFTVILKDPRTGSAAADLIWAPEHDRIRGRNVVTTLTSPHRLSPSVLAAARRDPDRRLAAMPSPRAAILIGGDGRQARFGEADIGRFVALLDGLAGTASLMATTSRRTPPALREAVAALVDRRGGFLWDGTGANPFPTMLALADAIVATGDSVNMVSEALAAGAPVLVFEPSGLSRRQRAFLDGLCALGATRPFAGRLEPGGAEPLDSTGRIADAVREGLSRHRRMLGLA